MNNTLVAVDLAKSVFEIAVSHEPGKVSKRLRLKREKVLEFFAQLPAAIVVMEACGSAQFWAREIEKLGHRVVLLPAQHARPYVLRDKTDRTDTVGLLEAFWADEMHNGFFPPRPGNRNSFGFDSRQYARSVSSSDGDSIT